MQNKIILIGGAPCAGKSFISQKLLEKLKIPWISADAIRDFMKEFSSEDKYPELFEFREPVEYLSEHTPKEIFENSLRRSMVVWKGIEALIRLNYSLESYIIEGVDVVPGKVHELMQRNKSIVPLFLVDTDKERMRNVIYTRGLWDDASKYSDSVKDKELEWLLVFNDWLKGETKKYNLPLIEVGDRSTLLDRCLKYIE